MVVAQDSKRIRNCAPRYIPNYRWTADEEFGPLTTPSDYTYASMRPSNGARAVTPLPGPCATQRLSCHGVMHALIPAASRDAIAVDKPMPRRWGRLPASPRMGAGETAPRSTTTTTTRTRDGPSCAPRQ